MVTPGPSEVDARVQKALEGTPYEASALTTLSGGSVNWTYVATLAKPLDDGARQVFVKHAEPYMKVRPDTTLSLDRADFEVECFKCLSGTPIKGEPDQGDAPSITIRTPSYYHYDKANSNQLLEYMPDCITLKDYVLKYYATSPSASLEPEARQIGKTLGKWLKGFAQLAASHSDLRAVAEKNSQGQFFRNLVTFTWLKDRVSQYPAVLSDAKDVFSEVEKAITEELKDPSKLQVIHGDFWTGNIIIPDTAVPRGGSNITLFVVDWEMMHLNVPNVDFGLMIAEFYFLWVFKSTSAGLWLLEAMVEAYGPVTEESAYRTALQVGAHFVCVLTDLNRVSEEELEKAASVGKEIIVHTWKKDLAWFKKSELACIFRQAR